ncbi:hypothetical protein [Kordiimonas sp.]|uniref:hypothetical protein n=1 Tax=Kordiimonas sp. TaxID=1970157 RepID=UPI003A94193D
MNWSLVSLAHASTEPSSTDNQNSWHTHSLSIAKLTERLNEEAPFITHFHPQPTPSLAYQANSNNLAVIFNRRNLVDCLLSWHHVMVDQAYKRQEELETIGQAVWAPLQIPFPALRRYIELSPEAQLSFLIENVAPWYIQYVANWENSFARFDRLKVVDFRELEHHSAAVLGEINETFGLEIDNKSIEMFSAANPRKVRSSTIDLPVTERDRETLHIMASRVHGTDFASRLLIG